MRLEIEPSRLNGTVRIPASKSHTIRAVAIAALANGKSVIEGPLDSLDTLSAVRIYRALGAQIDTSGANWIVNGTAGKLHEPIEIIDVGNSGTALRMAMGSAALLPASAKAQFTGDEQIRSRPHGPLLKGLNDLGAKAVSLGGDGRAPLEIGGELAGGKTVIRADSSQYLSSLLLCCPLAKGDSEIKVEHLNEWPYVQMTLDWLNSQGIRYEQDDWRAFKIHGNQSYGAFQRRIPADFSSATFFLVAAAITGSSLTLEGLEMSDSQGDKAVADYLELMGAEVQREADLIKVNGGELEGAEIDMNQTPAPDALPAMAVAAAAAKGKTSLVNVPQARIKETDRITGMAKELGKMGIRCEELKDGLVIHGGELQAAEVCGHNDHRIVMALAVAGLAAKGTTRVDTAEAVAVTFPNFVELMTNVGAAMRTSR
ncbi:MAG: 3-phosphoshikimate 1-carboxyvinyltransferase [Actinobacteria bacterium]|nr:3-phosphoshikimate 1-carboxyvinyltransferase [Actinomycetota bacterium]